MADPLLRIATDPNDRKEVIDFSIATERPIEYPSQWFNNHPGLKPEILVLPDAALSLPRLRFLVQQGLTDLTLDHRLVVKYLEMEFREAPGELTEDWESFGLQIGGRGDQITIDNLIRFNRTERAPGCIAGEAGCVQAEITKTIIYICSVYRLVLASNADYRKNLAKSMEDMIRACGGNDMDLSDAHTQWRSWVAYPPYVKMMAAIDMFLTEFPYHKYASARIGTIVTRFKDCSALISTQSILTSLGLKFTQFAEWIWTSKCADQFMRVIRGGEEMDNSRSYAMYFMDLGLSGKSPYSASVNYDLHFLYHTIGTSSNLVRSRNARMIGNPEINNVMTNAIVINYVLGNYARLDQQFSITGQAIEAEEEDDPQAVAIGGPPEGSDPMLWLGYIQGLGGKAPDFIIRRAAGAWEQAENLREGTIGEYLYKSAVAWLAANP